MQGNTKLQSCISFFIVCPSAIQIFPKKNMGDAQMCLGSNTMCLGLHDTHFNWATGQTWKRNVCLVQRPGVGAGSRWPGCRRGGRVSAGENQGDGWINMNALSIRTGTRCSKGDGARKPGTIHHPVKTGWPVEIHERAFQKYIRSCCQGKKRKLGTVAYCPVKTRVTRWWILTRFRWRSKLCS
jgi:hypothetical protein